MVTKCICICPLKKNIPKLTPVDAEDEDTSGSVPKHLTPLVKLCFPWRTSPR